MSETITVTPKGSSTADGDPTSDGTPVVLRPIAIAPGNTARSFVEGGDLDQVDFTIYLRLSDESRISDDDEVLVRGRHCRARVRKWVSPRTGRGGLEVLATSSTGKG